MSKSANPTAIGAFVIGAIVLAVIGTVTFASQAVFTQRQTFISYFDESVNGLDVGAPVKFKGVPIGQVSDILLRLDLEEETFQVPVLYEIDMKPLTDEVGTTVDLSNRRVLQEQIEQGLRAQLQMESFLTGKLYIELTFIENPRPPRIVKRAEYPQVPTVLSPLAQIGEEASGLVSDLRQIDVNTINENLVTFLLKANQKLDDLDTKEINRSILAAVDAYRDLAEAPEIRRALRDVPRVADRVDSTLVAAQALLRRVDGQVDPTAEDMRATSRELRATLQEMQRVLRRTNSAMSTDSGIGYQVEEALANLAEAAEALERLAVSLERDPSMFIRGKEPPEENGRE